MVNCLGDGLGRVLAYILEMAASNRASMLTPMSWANCLMFEILLRGWKTSVLFLVAIFEVFFVSCVGYKVESSRYAFHFS